jgi:PRTRC genetic system protein E
MKTNFFEHISALEFQGALNITLLKIAEGVLTISVYLPNASADVAGNVIPPMILKGNAAELDEGFFEAIAAPLKQTVGLFANLDAYQQSLKKAGELSKAELDKKNKGNNGKVTANSSSDNEDDDSEENANLFTAQLNEQKALAEKKKAYENALTQVLELSKQFKYAEAIGLMETFSDYTEKADDVTTKIFELQKHQTKYEAFLKDLA